MSDDSDKPEDEFAQFVCFKTADKIPVDLFQNSWIPFAEKFFSRGINTIILSEKLPLSGDLSPYKFVAKNCWASTQAIKGTFPRGLPSPSSRGHISVSQVPVFDPLQKKIKYFTKGHKIFLFGHFLQPFIMLCYLSHYLSSELLHELGSLLRTSSDHSQSYRFQPCHTYSRSFIWCKRGRT